MSCALRKSSCNEGPQRLYVRITNRCNAKCPKCAVILGNVIDIPLEFFKKVVGQAAKIGVQTIELTGGEAILHPQFDEVVESIFESGRLSIAMITNGAIPPKTLERIKLKGPVDRLTVSLDHPIADIHDAERVFPGLFYKAQRTIETASKLGIPVRVNTVITKRSIDVLGHFFDFDWFGNVDYWHWIPIKHRPFDIPSPSQIQAFNLNREKFLQAASARNITIENASIFGTSEKSFLYAQAGEYTKEFYGKRRCYITRSMAMVEPSGELMPCNSYEYSKRQKLSLGNLNEESLLSLLEAASDWRDVGKSVDCAECDPVNVLFNWNIQD